MTIVEAILLGIIQGLTEFLPISSSGHLLLVGSFLKVNSEDNLIFAVAVHGATVLSTIVVFRKDIVIIIKDLLQIELNNNTQYVGKLLISAIPITIIGLAFQTEINEFLFKSNLLVGVMLMLTGILLLLGSKVKNTTKDPGNLSAFIIGLSQTMAILPGISRSGATITAALFLGIKREEAARFSFLMVLIPIIGANLKTLLSQDLNGSRLNAFTLGAGFIAAFITGYIACNWMVQIVKKGRLAYFAYYCFFIGLITILLFF